MALSGYIKIHRKFLEWEWYDDPVTKAVFLDLLLNATHTEKEWRGVHLLPGQVPTSRHSLSTRLGLSEQQIRTAISHLQATGEITKTATNKYTVITIEKWADYQVDDEATNQQDNQQSTSQLTINQPQRKNVKNIYKEKENKKEKESPQKIREEFDDLWDMYPRKQGKATAYRHYEKARREGATYEDVKRGIQAYAEYAAGTDTQYVKMGSTFFSQKAWDDDWSTQKETRKPTSNVPVPPEPPRYKQFEPEPDVKGVPMPDEVRRKYGKVIGGVI